MPISEMSSLGSWRSMEDQDSSREGSDKDAAHHCKPDEEISFASNDSSLLGDISALDVEDDQSEFSNTSDREIAEFLMKEAG